MTDGKGMTPITQEERDLLFILRDALTDVGMAVNGPVGLTRCRLDGEIEVAVITLFVPSEGDETGEFMDGTPMAILLTDASELFDRLEPFFDYEGTGTRGHLVVTEEESA